VRNSGAKRTGQGVEIENKIVGGAIPKEYINPVIDGIEEPLKGRPGGLSGVDVKVAIVDGTFHEVTQANWLLRWLVFLRQRCCEESKCNPAGTHHEGEVTTPDEYQATCWVILIGAAEDY